MVAADDENTGSSGYRVSTMKPEVLHSSEAPEQGTVRSGGLPRSSSLFSGPNIAAPGAASATLASANRSAGAAGRRANGAGTAARSACSSRPSCAFSL